MSLSCRLASLATTDAGRPKAETVTTARLVRPPSALHHLGQGRIDIVSGSFGAGHDAAAREIAARFRARGFLVQVWDVVDFFPGRLGELLRRAYFRQLRTVPGSWETLLHRLEPGRPLHTAVVRALCVAAEPLRDLAALRPDVVISTHPFASQALGQLRRTGRLDVPVVTYLTDMSVHPLWVHEGVDLHLALHDIPAGQARARGATVRVVEPLVPTVGAQRPADEVSRRALRVRLGLSERARLALVTGGSLGIGELAHTATDITATGLATPVVLCGENEQLRRRLSAQPDVVALGWRDDVADLLVSVDCVVQNAGGFTSLEALAAATPMLSYRCIPGHGRSNAQALHDAGLVPWARSREELGSALATALAAPAHGPACDQVRHPDVVDAVFPELAELTA